MNNNQTIEKLTSYGPNALDPKSRTEVLDIIRTTPDIWREFGDLCEWPRQLIYAMVCPGSVPYECTIEGINKIKEQLQEPGDSQLERLAIEQILTCHIQAAKTGYRLEKLEPTEETPNESKHWIRAHNQSQARLMKSMLTLMKLRKLKADLGIKLMRNRPFGYDKSDFLTKSEQEIIARITELRSLTEEKRSGEKS